MMMFETVFILLTVLTNNNVLIMQHEPVRDNRN